MVPYNVCIFMWIRNPRCIVLAKCFYSRSTCAVCLNLSFLGSFVKYILQKLKDEINKIKQNLSDVLDFDEMPQFKDNMKNTEETESEQNGERQFSDDDRLDNLRTSKIMEAFTEGELLTLIVRDKNHQETLFCDQGNEGLENLPYLNFITESKHTFCGSCSNQPLIVQPYCNSFLKRCFYRKDE